MNTYTVKDFQAQFPNDDVCLDYIFTKKYPSHKGWYRVKGRTSYANAQGKQIYPLKGTIFQKSNTPLTSWLYAIYLFSTSKNGVSAKELERQLGVTYKCAWRIAKQIRSLMSDDSGKLGGDGGEVEVDETYVGGFRKAGQGGKGKTPVFGMLERGGSVKTKVIEARQSHLILNEIKKGIKTDSHLMSDKFGVYTKAEKLGYAHSSVNHWRKEFVRGNVSTNSIEGFWSQLKRSISGTYHSVSSKHLQEYADEFAFRYNHRSLPIFEALVARI